MVPYQLRDDKLVLVLGGNPVTIDKTNPVFARVAQGLKDKLSEEDIRKLLKKADVAEYVKGSSVEYRGGVVYYKGEALHNNIAARVKAFADEGLPFEFLLKFIENIQENPSYNSRNQLYDFLEHTDLVIDENGYILGYKALTKDYMDKHTRTISNHVGATVKMDRSLIDDNPNTHCSKGLHFGSIKYVRGFGYGDDRFVIIQVNPKNVVCVPNDHSCQKARVCEYYVLRDMEGEMDFPLYTSSGEPYVQARDAMYDVNFDGFDYEDDYYDEDEVYSYDEDDFDDSWDDEEDDFGLDLPPEIRF